MGQSSALGVRNHVFDGGDGKTLADSGTLIDLLVVACGEGDALDDFADIFRNLEALGIMLILSIEPGFLGGDRNAFFDCRRIMGANFRSDAIFQRRNDLAARGVVLGVRAEDDSYIEWQAGGEI